jgi:Fe-S cluster assembly protein SufD
MKPIQNSIMDLLQSKGIVLEDVKDVIQEMTSDETIRVTRKDRMAIYLIHPGVHASIYETIHQISTDLKTIIIGLPNSNINYYTLNEENSIVETIDIYLFKNANINSNIIELSKTKANIQSNLYFLESGSHANANSVAITNGASDVEVTINFVHQAKSTTAVMSNYGIAKDQSKIFYTGISRIEKGNSKTDSYQKTRGLNLSKDAKVIARPYLYIDEFDVIAGHGASIGSVSEDDLFYLMSRGLKKEEAEKMIINGFIRPIIDKVVNESFKDRLIDIIDQRLS